MERRQVASELLDSPGQRIAVSRQKERRCAAFRGRQGYIPMLCNLHNSTYIFQKKT